MVVSRLKTWQMRRNLTKEILNDPNLGALANTRFRTLGFGTHRLPVQPTFVPADTKLYLKTQPNIPLFSLLTSNTFSTTRCTVSNTSIIFSRHFYLFTWSFLTLKTITNPPYAKSRVHTRSTFIAIFLFDYFRLRFSHFILCRISPPTFVLLFCFNRISRVLVFPFFYKNLKLKCRSLNSFSTNKFHLERQKSPGGVPYKCFNNLLK